MSFPSIGIKYLHAFKEQCTSSILKNVGGYIVQFIHNNMTGLGFWFTSMDRAILKVRRKKSSSKGKSSLPKKSPASFERESVADCNDQTTLESFASSKDPAMVNTVEEPSAIIRIGTCDDPMQRTEARSHRRNYVPMKKGKAHVVVVDFGQRQAGDSSREKGGTQKFFTVHSQL